MRFRIKETTNIKSIFLKNSFGDIVDISIQPSKLLRQLETNQTPTIPPSVFKIIEENEMELKPNKQKAPP